MKVLLVSEGASELAGALQNLVKRLTPSANFEIHDDRVSRNDIHAHHGKGQGHFKRAVRWMLEARKRGYDALILVIDEDGCVARSQEIANAQRYDGTSIRRALGVAIRTFDAWMLADEKALSSVLKYTVSRQPDPEKILSPKSVCNQLLGDSDVVMPWVDMCVAVAAAVDLQILESRCTKSFAPFAQRVRQLPDEAAGA